MRLGQLARRLAISPTEITEFLISNEIPVGDGSNTRLTDDQVRVILQRFAPSLLIPELEEIKTGTSTVPEVTTAGEETDHKEPAAMASESLPAEETPHTVTSEEATQTEEVIRAPKKELPGLKVVGKIELPEPKKKELEEPAATPSGDVKAESESPAEVRKRYSTEKKNGDYSRRSKSHPVKNSLALRREREARQAEKKKQLEAEREKERRKQNYLKKVSAKQSVPTRPARLIDEPLETVSVKELAAPTTLWGKFLKWLWRS